ncbi:MAG: MarR family winged helix-turn-helix transcriptional regulator [Limnothrix sp. BL-A-16]
MNATARSALSTAPWREVLAPNGLGYRIRLLSQLMGRRFQELLEPHGLTPFHWVVLCCLWDQDGLATCAIGDRLRQVGGTMTGALDRMEERGLIRRERDCHDRRVWRIWLTDLGWQMREILPPIAVQMREETLHGFSEPDRQLMSDLVDRAIGNLIRSD